MRRAFVLAGACLLVSLIFAPAAGADVVESSGVLAYPEGGAPPPDPPDYVLEEDGTVIVDGDVVTECSSFSINREEGLFGGFGDQELAQRVLEQCVRSGLSSSGGDLSVGDSRVVVRPDTEASPTTSSKSLPETGGLSLTSLAGLASGLALICGGLLLRRRKG